MIGFHSVVAQSTAKISGIITYGQEQPLPAAAVALKKAADSVVVKVLLTDEKGAFEFEQLLPGNYYLMVTAAGFEKYSGSVITIMAQDTLKILSPISLEGNKPISLKTVDVTATKPLVERKIDRTIVNVDAFISSAGSNALEMLEKSPGVAVSNNGAISLKGKSGVVVFIDNRPTYLSGADLANYLKSLPAETLDKIEIMTNPPARYDASGSAGVINIRTKKTRSPGLNGSATANYAQGFYWRTNSSLNFNYRTGKINYFGNLSYNANNDYQDLDIQRRYLDANGKLTSSFTQSSFFKNKERAFVGKLGFDYYVSKSSTLGVVVNGFTKKSPRTATNESQSRNAANQIDSIIRANNEENSRWNNGSINLNMLHRFDSTGKELSIDLDYNKYSSDNEQSFLNDIFDAGDEKKGRDAMTGDLPSDINIYSLKADYTHPFKEGLRMDVGLKASFTKTDNTARYFSITANGPVVDNDKTNHFKYDEHINAAYMNFSKELKRWSFQVGLRLENTISNGHQLGNQVKPDSSFKRRYTNLFPTVYVNYKLDSNANNQLAFSYGRRIDRPYYQDLNPFIFPVDKFTFFAGNPFLRPQFSDNLELSYIFRNWLNTTLLYSRTTDLMYETIEQTNNTFFSRTGNIGSNVNMGVSVDANFKLAKWWTCNMYTELMNNSYKGILYSESLNTNATTWFASMNWQFKISSLWAAEVGGYYKTAAVTGQFRNEPIGQLNAGVQKKVLNKRGSVRLNVRDIFYTLQPRGRITAVKLTDASFHNYLDSRVYSLSFTYNFGRSGQAPRKQSGGAESEKGRVKTD